MAIHDFDAARRERNREREPLQFVLGGETFTCAPVISAGLGFDLVEAQGSGDTTTVAIAYRQFVLAILATDDDRERFDKVIHDQADPISGEDLAEIITWVAKEYAGRPTTRSSDSSGGPQSNGGSSKPAKSARARKRSRASTSES